MLCRAFKNKSEHASTRRTQQLQYMYSMLTHKGAIGRAVACHDLMLGPRTGEAQWAEP